MTLAVIPDQTTTALKKTQAMIKTPVDQRRTIRIRANLEGMKRRKDSRSYNSQHCK